MWLTASVDRGVARFLPAPARYLRDNPFLEHPCHDRP
jgi:hypothetical protein